LFGQGTLKGDLGHTISVRIAAGSFSRQFLWNRRLFEKEDIGMISLKRRESRPEPSLFDSVIGNEYDRLLAYCRQNAVPDNLIEQTLSWQKGLWKEYYGMIERAKFFLKGKVVVDFGCKYGLLMPILIKMEVKEAIGVDVWEDYLKRGSSVFGALYPNVTNVSFLECDQGHIPLQPETVDFVFVTEVISHVNPAYLETVYSEISRILKPGGMVLLSDGNNIANSKTSKKLLSLYEAWENGPDGVKIGQDTVQKSFLTQRKEIISQQCCHLDSDQVDFLARNTSGLFGEYLKQVIKRYESTGELLRQPYRRGECPTNPDNSGAVMERGFDPHEVMTALARHGLRCKKLPFERAAYGRGLKVFIKDLIFLSRYYLVTFLKQDWYNWISGGFRIVGTKTGDISG
jgi:ubiquinone/menaquinone biosynthesis C-methylase UbiE